MFSSWKFLIYIHNFINYSQKSYIQYYIQKIKTKYQFHLSTKFVINKFTHKIPKKVEITKLEALPRLACSIAAGFSSRSQSSLKPQHSQV